MDVEAHFLDDDGDEVETAPLDTLSLPISPPITAKGATYFELNLREPRVSEIRASEEVLGANPTPASLYDSEIKLIGLVSEWPEAALFDLPSSVHAEAARFLGEFEARGRAMRDRGPVLLIEFDPPIVVQKGPHASMHLREPKVSERKRALQHHSRGITPATMRASDIGLVTEISGWHPPAVLKMPISGFARAIGFLDHFLEPGPRTGGRSRPT